jgi:hypothetical protein
LEEADQRNGENACIFYKESKKLIPLSEKSVHTNILKKDLKRITYEKNMKMPRDNPLSKHDLNKNGSR